MRTCKTCLKDLEDSLFYFHKATGGPLRHCKPCVQKSRLQYRKSNRENKKIYDAQYRSERSEVLNAGRRERHRRVYATAEGRKHMLEKARLNRIASHAKYAARARVAYALKTGKIEKQPCRVCGTINTAAHHEDYSKPLDVIWLCYKHHGEIHQWVRPPLQISST